MTTNMTLSEISKKLIAYEITKIYSIFKEVASQEHSRSRESWIMAAAIYMKHGDDVVFIENELNHTKKTK